MEVAQPHLFYTKVQCTSISTVVPLNSTADASSEGIAFWCLPHSVSGVAGVAGLPWLTIYGLHASGGMEL
jgi:hypothetical protein